MERRDLLVKNVNEIKGHIMLSEMTHITVSLSHVTVKQKPVYENRTF